MPETGLVLALGLALAYIVCSIHGKRSLLWIIFPVSDLVATQPGHLHEQGGVVVLEVGFGFQKAGLGAASLVLEMLLFYS